jgi:hypothetical protein
LEDISEQDTNNQYKVVYIKVSVEGTWYIENREDGSLSECSAPSGYTEESQISQEDQGVNIINEYVNYINKNSLVDMG